MIDNKKSYLAFKNFLNKYLNHDQAGFNLKVTHTYHVITNAKIIAESLNLSEEDIQLAELIALLHDIGRFEELTILNKFDSTKFDHASYGVKMLFEDNLIRTFIADNQYDEIIKIAILNHNKLQLPNNLSKRELLHCKIIRDADKLDNFRVKKEEPLTSIFPHQIKNESEMENSLISPKVYQTIEKNKCIDIYDRKTPLDYWLCVLAFIFDLNFPITYQIIQDKDYINILLNRFTYHNINTKQQIEKIRIILNNYVKDQIK